MASGRRTWVVLGWLALAACQRGERSEPKKAKAEAEESAGAEQRVTCGKVQCQVGEVCCNPSCAICTVPEGMCTQQFCDEEAPPDAEAGKPLPPPDSALTCDNVRCAAGTHCELVEVQCVRAPCDPQPQCRPDPVTSPKPGR